MRGPVLPRIIDDGPAGVNRGHIAPVKFFWWQNA